MSKLQALQKILRLEDDQWIEKQIFVELESNEFARGALRAAYKMKLHDADTTSDWVAKRYIKPIENEDKVYEDDVRVQVLSKAYADQYNTHGMPKTVDFVVPFLMILDEKKYCVEPFIRGEYRKHSNNSGFIDVESMRNTPHAFSHFSLVSSGYRVLICDIQGVNDLYTDPTVHTWTGAEFGDNNLGLRGMALFLYSHACSPLCKKLTLPAFDLWGSDAPQQNRAPKLAMMKATTMTNSYTELMSKMKESMAAPAAGQPSNTAPRLITPPNSFPKKPDLHARIHYELAKMHESGRLAVLDNMYKEDLPDGAKAKEKNHTAAALYHYQKAAIGGHVGAMLRVAAILFGRNCSPELIHLKNPQLGVFYLNNAAARGSKPAALAAMEYYLSPSAPDWTKASDLIASLLTPATSSSHADARGTSDPAAAATLTMSKLSVSPVEEESFEGEQETWGWKADFSTFELRASLAEMYEKGGHGLTADGSKAAELYRAAGDEAMAQGKGKLANKYYAQAEVCDS